MILCFESVDSRLRGNDGVGKLNESKLFKIIFILCLCGFFINHAQANNFKALPQAELIQTFTHVTPAKAGTHKFSALPKTEQARIADLIFRNECNRKEECLVSWNDGEDFASLGIGHFIWFPKGSKAPFQESFPDLLVFFEAHSVEIPAGLVDMLQPSQPCPWQTKEDFLRPENQETIQRLRNFLANTKSEQATFIMQRLSHALSKMLEVVSSPKEQQHIKTQFERVANSSLGWYVLADYVNFKGEGIKVTERYQGKGWGLSQVLLNMHIGKPEDEAIQAFVDSATFVLERRVQLSPPERNEIRWLKGWKKRLNTYQEN